MNPTAAATPWMSNAAQLTQFYGRTLCDGSTLPIAWKVLATTGAVAFAYSALRYALDGSQQKPWHVLFHILGIAFMLTFYDSIVPIIHDSMAGIGKQISNNGQFSNFLQTFWKGVGSTALGLNTSVSTPSSAPAVAPISDTSTTMLGYIKQVYGTVGANLAATATMTANIAQGVVTSVVSLLSIAAVVIAYELFSMLGWILYNILYAVGPLAMAFSLLPGGRGVFHRWLTAIFEISSWSIVGAVVFEILATSAAATVWQTSNANWLSILIANLLFVVSVILVPVISARLVGSGMGLLGPVLGLAAVGLAKSAMTAPLKVKEAYNAGASAYKAGAGATTATINGVKSLVSTFQGPPASGSLARQKRPNASEAMASPRYQQVQPPSAMPRSVQAHESKNERTMRQSPDRDRGNGSVTHARVDQPQRSPQQDSPPTTPADSRRASAVTNPKADDPNRDDPSQPKGVAHVVAKTHEDQGDA